MYKNSMYCGDGGIMDMGVHLFRRPPGSLNRKTVILRIIHSRMAMQAVCLCLPLAMQKAKCLHLLQNNLLFNLKIFLKWKKERKL